MPRPNWKSHFWFLSVIFFRESHYQTSVWINSDRWSSGPLTSYSCESLRLSLALSSSVCSVSSEMGIGGWFIIPVHRVDGEKHATEVKKTNIRVSTQQTRSRVHAWSHSTLRLWRRGFLLTKQRRLGFSGEEACAERCECQTVSTSDVVQIWPELKHSDIHWYKRTGQEITFWVQINPLVCAILLPN